jgi:hypothetical protein
MHHLAIKRIQEDDQTFGIFGLKIASLKSKRNFVVPGELLLSHQRQLSNFVNMLYNHHRQVSFTIRTIIDPQGSPDALGQMEIAFLVRFLQEQGYDSLEAQAEALYKNIKILLGGTFSDYVWQVITDGDALDDLIWPFESPEPVIAEVRRREESVLLDSLVAPRTLGFADELDGRTPAKDPEGVYYVHPFSPAVGGFETLLKTLMQGHQKLVLSATISPTVCAMMRLSSWKGRLCIVRDTDRMFRPRGFN